MANYYTYGAIPNAEETVFGPLQAFQEGGQAAALPQISIFEEGYTPAAGSEPVATDSEIDPEQTAKLMAQLSLLRPGAFGNMGSVSDPNIAASARTITDTRPAGGLQGQQFEEGYLESQKASPLLGIWQSGLADVLAEDPSAQARVEEMETERAERIAGLEESIPKLKPLSDLLKAGEFKEAFDYAQENGLVDQLMNTENLKSLRGPFSKEEMSAFFNAIPPDVAKEYTGEGWVFDPSAGVEGSLDPLGTGGEGAMEEGFPDPNRAFTRKDDSIIKKVVDVGMQVALAAAGLPPLTAAAAAGVAKAATTGGDLEAALKSAALAGLGSYVGGKVGEAMEAAKGGTEAAAGQAITEAAKTAGSIDDLAEVVITATKRSLPGGLASVGTTLAGEVAGQGAKAAAKDLEQAVEPLEEVTVTAQRPPATSLLDVAAPALQVAPDIEEILRKTPEPEIELPVEEPPIDDLEEVTIEAQRPITDELTLPPFDLVEPPPLQEVLPEPEIELPPEELPEDMEEITIETDRPVTDELTMPPFSLYEPPPLEDILKEPDIDIPLEESPLDDLEEVTIEAQRPVTEDLIIPPFDLITGPSVEEIVETLPEPDIDIPLEESPLDDLEEVTVTAKRPPATNLLNVPPFDLIEPPDPRDILKESPAPEINYPEQSAIDKLIERYGTLENALKILGALGGALSSGPKAPVGGGAPTGGLGGALPKYTYTREQLSPDIDYYTYGTRPEAKFFEGQFQLAEPTQPAGPDTGTIPLKDQPVFAQGGLTGYAQGGSKAPRYVDGPGSGRDDKIPALLSDGEYVIDAETLALLGDGSTKEGARRMDQFRANIRKHKGRALSRGRISPNAKAPDKYMGGGLI